MSPALHILTHSSTPRLVTQPPTHLIKMLASCSFQWYMIPHSSYCIDAALGNFINTHILVTKEFIISRKNGFHSNQNHVICQFQQCQSTYLILVTLRLKLTKLLSKVVFPLKYITIALTHRLRPVYVIRVAFEWETLGLSQVRFSMQTSRVRTFRLHNLVKQACTEWGEENTLGFMGTDKCWWSCDMVMWHA